MIRLFTLGGLTVRKDSGGDSVIALAHVKRNALLTYLAVDRAGGPHSRDTLLALFWPESDERRARDALNQLLQSLRRDLGEGVFETGNGNVIGPDQDVLWCDAVAFELLLDEGQEEEALALYRGALLEGFHLSGCLEFERWLEDERRRLERRAAAATWSLAEQALAEGRTAQAAHWGRRSLTLSPDDESVLQRVIELLDRVGDRAGAIRAYEGFAKRLQEDYDATPAPETTELIAAVRSREGGEQRRATEYAGECTARETTGRRRARECHDSTTRPLAHSSSCGCCDNGAGRNRCGRRSRHEKWPGRGAGARSRAGAGGHLPKRDR